MNTQVIEIGANDSSSPLLMLRARRSGSEQQEPAAPSSCCSSKGTTLLQHRVHIPVNPHVRPFADWLLNAIVHDFHHVGVGTGIAIEC